MALVTRRYRYVTAANASLQKYVAPSAAINTQYVNSVDIDVDNTVPGTEEALDEYMATLGFINEPNLSSPVAANGMVGLGGSFWYSRALSANLNAQMNLGPGNNYASMIMPRAGYFLQATSYFSTAASPAAALTTFQLAKAATPAGATAPIVGTSWTMDGTSFPRVRTINWTPGMFTFAATEKVEINVVCNASMNGVNASINLNVVYTE